MLSHIIPALIALFLAMTTINAAPEIRAWWTGSAYCEDGTFTGSGIHATIPGD
jgi:hypothetical protein